MANEDETRTSSSVVGVITRRLQIQDALNLVHGGDAGLFPCKGSVESIEEDEMSYASEIDDEKLEVNLKQYCGELATD